MVVCRFFLKGCCKFGDRCRFEHPRNTSDWQHGGGQYSAGGQDSYQENRNYQKSYNQNQGNFSSSFTNQNRFTALSSDYQTNNRGGGPGSSGFGDGGNTEPQPGEILESIKRDIEEWDASGMWPYSCYRPNRAQRDVPGFEDLSPEELRLEEKENRFENYKIAVSTSANTLQRKHDMMKKPSAELQNALISVYRGQYKTDSFGGQSLFGMQDLATLEIFIKSGSTLFQSSSSTKGIPTPPTGLFSSSSTSGSSSGFGSSTIGSGFGTTSQPHGMFSTPSPTPSGFGQSTQATGFGQSTQSSGFGNSGGVFGKPVEPKGTGLFGKPAEPQATGLFGKPATSQGTGLFGKPATQGGNLFGSSQGVGLFGKPAPIEDDRNEGVRWYTATSDLTTEEKEQYEAASFTLGKIPTRPPPLELVKPVA